MLLRIIIAMLLSNLAQAGSDCEGETSDNMKNCLLSKAWKLEYNKKNIQVYMRHRDDSDIYEMFLSTGLAASAQKTYETLADFGRYTEFMPDTLACSQFVVDNDEMQLVWQRINFNWLFNLIIDDQYYLIDVELDDSKSDTGRYRIDWKLASHELYKLHRASGKKCTEGRRIKSNEGYWEVAERSDGKSDVTYYLRTAPSGWLVEKLNHIVAWITRTEAPKTLLRLKKRVE